MTTIITFPFEQIGIALRDMSLSGAAGNAAAIIIYAVLSLLPVAAWLILKKKKKARKADYMLFLLSATLFYVLYYSINPGLFQTSINGAGGLYLSGIFYSVVVTYGVIRIQSMAMNGGKETIQRFLKLFLYLLAVLFAVVVLLELGVTLPAAMETTKESYESTMAFAALVGTEISVHPEIMYGLTIMESVVKAVPYALDIVIVFEALKLLKELQKDWFSEASVKASERLAGVTGRILVIISVIGLIFNICHLFGRNYVTASKLVVEIPVLSIIFLLAVLLAARYIRASQELKTDNDLFI